MTTEESKIIKSLIITTNLYYGKKLDDTVVLMQVQDLQDLPVDDIVEAFTKYRIDPANRFAPLPANIRALIAPEVSDEQVGVEAASRIIEAMARVGWVDPQGARAFMGEIAWEVVVREGGWTALCERTKNDDLPILKAQWRELAKVVAIRQKQSEWRKLLAAKQPGQLEDKS